MSTSKDLPPTKDRNEYQRAWRRLHGERHRKYMREYYREYRVKNKERLLVRDRDNRVLKRERRREVQRAYIARNRERITKQRHEFYAKNKERLRRTIRENLLRDSPCIKDCGRGTKSISGFCAKCEIGVCVKCGYPMRILQRGQREHKVCAPWRWRKKNA